MNGGASDRVDGPFLVATLAVAVLVAVPAAMVAADPTPGPTPKAAGSTGVAGTDATNVTVTIERTYNFSRGDRGTVVVPASGGGYVIAGSTVGPDGYVDALVLFVGSDGSLQSSRTYGTPNGAVGVSDLVRTTDGGYALAGHAAAGTGTDVWILKFDPVEGVVYERTFGVGDDRRERASALVATPNGGVAVVGTVARRFDTGVQPVFYRIDDSGNVQNRTPYSVEANRTGQDIARTSGGGYLLVGGGGGRYYAGSENPEQAWVYRVGSDGTVRERSVLRNGSASEVVPTDGGGYVVAGRSLGVIDAGAGGWLQGFAADGSVQWTRRIDSQPAVAATDDGGYVLARSFRGGMVTNPAFRNGFIEKRSADGRLRWNRTFGVTNRSFLSDVTVAGPGQYAAVGSTNGSAWLIELSTGARPTPTPTTRTAGTTPGGTRTATATVTRSPPTTRTAGETTSGPTTASPGTPTLERQAGSDGRATTAGGDDGGGIPILNRFGGSDAAFGLGLVAVGVLGGAYLAHRRGSGDGSGTDQDDAG